MQTLVPMRVMHGENCLTIFYQEATNMVRALLGLNLQLFKKLIKFTGL